MGLSLGGFTNSIFPGVGSLLGGGSGGLFGTSQGTVPFTNTTSPLYGPALNYGVDQARSIYNQGAQSGSLFNQAQGLTSGVLSGAYLNPESNPYLKASVNDALGLAKSSFAGQYGGAAGANLNNSGYQEGLARTLGNIATNAYSNAYGQERQNQMAAIPFASSLPYANLQGYMGSISPALSFSTQQGQQPYYQNNTATTLGALAGGAGLMKMFSDRRLKSDIVKLSDDPRGFGIYEFTIFGERKIGVMADEIEKVIPEAVSEVSGFKMVDYGLI